jgi:hypothetical protein
MGSPARPLRTSHVSGRVPALLVVPLGVGVLMAALAATELAAQTARAPGLRTTIEDQDDARLGRAKQPKRPTVTDPSPAGPGTNYGSPPGSGAGQTGFVSGKPKRKSKTGTETTSPTTLGAPLSLSSTASSVTPDKDAAADKAKAKAKQKKGAGAAKKVETAAKPATAPRAPAVLQREQAKQDFNALPNTSVPLRKRPAEDDPYEQLGIRAGTFLVRPAIETSAGYDTNPRRVENGPGSAFVKVAPELYARSDWLRHEVVVDMRGSQIWYKETPDQNRPDFDGKVTGRIDVTRDTRGLLEARYRIATDNPGSPNLQAGLAELPIFTTIGGSAGVAHRFNRFEIAVKGSADRTEYADSKLTDGTTVSNKGRDFNQYGVQLRGSYELTPGIIPFAQVDVDTRNYDLPVDAGGVNRDSNGIQGKVGTTFEISRKLVGEIAVGYLLRTYQDPTLQNLAGLLVDGSLVWTATGLTTARLTARTSANESTQPGVSGVFTHDYGLQVDHAFRRWLIGTAKLGFGLDDYVGSDRVDQRYAASVGIIYKLSRSWQVKGEVRREWLKSNVEGADYTANIAMVGLRWQP